jgi:transmembrane sensor
LATLSLYILIRKFLGGKASAEDLSELNNRMKNEESSVLESMEKDWLTFKAGDHQVISDEKGDQMLAKILQSGGKKTRHRILTAWLQRSAAVWLLLLLAAGLSTAYRFNHTKPVVYFSKQNRKIVLPDGTQVYLRSGSRLSYRQSFWADQRNVQFTGEAFFDVHPDKKQPFIIKTPNATVRVVGTSFNLKQYKQGMWVAVSEGKVQLSNQEGKMVSLAKNQLGQVILNGTLTKVNTDVSNYSSWQPGRPLIFNNMPFGQVASQLERLYGVKMHWNKSLESKTLTASSRYDTLPNILNKIALTLDLDYHIENETVFFTIK